MNLSFLGPPSDTLSPWIAALFLVGGIMKGCEVVAVYPKIIDAPPPMFQFDQSGSAIDAWNPTYTTEDNPHSGWLPCISGKDGCV